MFWIQGQSNRWITMLRILSNMLTHWASFLWRQVILCREQLEIIWKAATNPNTSLMLRRLQLLFKLCWIKLQENLTADSYKWLGWWCKNLATTLRHWQAFKIPLSHGFSVCRKFILEFCGKVILSTWDRVSGITCCHYKSIVSVLSPWIRSFLSKLPQSTWSTRWIWS